MRSIIKFRDGDYIMRVSSKLAKEIGLKESILLLQIEYLVSISNNLKDEKYWTYHNISLIQKDMFPFWGRSTFYRILDKLVEKKYLLKYKNSYTINDTKLSQIGSIKSHIENPNETNYSQNDTPESQNGRLIKNKNKIIKDSINKEQEEEDLICSKEQIKQAKLDLSDTNKILPIAETILDEWNSIAKKIEGLTVHTSVNSKVKTGKKSSTKLFKIISLALSMSSPTEIIESIRTYGIVITSDLYYYNYKFKTLGLFLTSEKGLKQFSSTSRLIKLKKGYTNPIEELYNEFKPITEIYDRQNLLDKNKQTYFGFQLDKIKNIEYTKTELDYLLNNSYRNVEYSDFCDLELVIAALMFSRKQNPQLPELSRYMQLWKNWKSTFKDTAIRLLKGKMDDMG